MFNLSKKKALSNADIQRLPYAKPTSDIQDSAGAIYLVGYHDIGDAPW
jgi:hypothetical protein